MRKDSSLNVVMFMFSILGACLAFLLGELLLAYSPALPFDVPFWVQCGLYLFLAVALSCAAMAVSEMVKSGNYLLKHQREFGLSAGKAAAIFLHAALVLGILTQFLYSWGGVESSGGFQYQGTMIVSDVSGSMYDNDPTRASIDAMLAYTDTVPLGEYFGIILFHSEFEVLRQYAPLRSENERTELKRAISDIEYGGGTEIEEALVMAFGEIRRQASPNWPGLVLLFSDGESDIDFIRVRRESMGNTANPSNAIPVNTIFLSESPLMSGHQMLRIADDTGGEYIHLDVRDDPSELRSAFSRSRETSLNWLDDQHLIHGTPGADEDLIIRTVIRVALLLLWGVMFSIFVVLFLNNNRLIKHFLILKLVVVFVCTLAFPFIILFIEGGYANMIARAVLVLGICILFPPTYSWDINEFRPQFRMHSAY